MTSLKCANCGIDILGKANRAFSVQAYEATDPGEFAGTYFCSIGCFDDFMAAHGVKHGSYVSPRIDEIK